MPTSTPMGILSPAATDLGLGGLLADQTKSETDEMRKKRLQQQQLNQMGAANLALFGVAGGTGS